MTECATVNADTMRITRSNALLNMNGHTTGRDARNRGNEEHDQEQDVVVSGPDVPDPLLQRLAKATGAAPARSKELAPLRAASRAFSSPSPDQTTVRSSDRELADPQGFDAIGAVISGESRQQEWLATIRAVGQLPDDTR